LTLDHPESKARKAEQKNEAERLSGISERAEKKKQSEESMGALTAGGENQARGRLPTAARDLDEKDRKHQKPDRQRLKQLETGTLSSASWNENSSAPTPSLEANLAEESASRNSRQRLRPNAQRPRRVTAGRRNQRARSGAELKSPQVKNKELSLNQILEYQHKRGKNELHHKI
jgi:hypothetical protein